MKNTIKVDTGLSFAIENKATAVRVDLVTTFMTKGVDLTPDRAYALADALTIAAKAVECSTAGVDMQRLVNQAEGLVK